MAQFQFKRTGDADYPRYLKILLQGPPKSGKHQANGTPVLTPMGWRAIETLAIGDLVIGSDGHPTEVVGVFPQGVKPMRRVTTDDGGQTLAGDTHLWTVLPHGNSVRTETTDEIAKRMEANPRYTYLPMPQPIQLVDQLVGEYIAPYALGLLLGDGTLASGSVCFTKPEPVMWRALADLLPGHTISQPFDGGKTVRIAGLRSRIDALGLGVRSEAKFIPSQYLWTSVENRMSLLAGLLDTDGGMNGKSTCFYTSSRPLCDDVVTLVRSLGGVATVRPKQHPTYTYLGERLTGRTAYTVSIRLPSELGCPFRLTRKALAWEAVNTAKRPPTRRIVSIEPVEDTESTCIMVANNDGLYVTEDFIVTHNTTFLASAPNIVVAAVEAGLMSIAHMDIPYVEVDGTDKLQTLHTVLGDETMRAKAAKQLGLPQIDTVAIDTLDAWQEILKKEILKENRRSSMQQADWGTLKERMSAVLKSFVALPVNVIFTVHTSTTQDDESRLIYAPALQGSIKDDVAGYVDFSLLAFRDRQVDAQGTPRIAYFLKNEGDLKNPSLGNRAAGRVPEICLPDFKTLHDAVFNGIKREVPSQNPTEVTVDAPTPVAQPVPTKGIQVTTLPEPESEPAPQSSTQQVNGAQSVSTAPAQPVADQAPPAPAAPSTPAAPPATPSRPSGVPQDDNDKLINAGGLQVLTKHYMAHSLALPPDIKTWTLGKARLIAKWFVAVKADALAGQVTSHEQIVEYLQAYDAYGGDVPGVQTGVENVPTPPKPSVEPAGEVTSPAVEADATPTPSDATDDKAEADALALVKEELGGVEIGREVAAGTKCATCGNDVDDLDVANLAMTRFSKPLCVKDYKAESKQKASA